MLTDIIAGHLNMLMYALVADQQRKYPSVSIYEHLCHLYYFGDQCLMKYKNKFYDIVKVIHPSLAIASVTASSDLLIIGNFKTEILKSLLEKGIDVLHPFISLLGYTEFQPQYWHMLLEVSGLWKMWGHPIIDMDAGVAKVMKLTSNPNFHLYDAGIYYTWVFRYHLCKQYYRKNHSWPSIEVSKDLSPIIARNYVANT